MLTSPFRYLPVPAAALVAAKLAVTEAGAFIVTVCGFVDPVSTPVNPVNAYPVAGVAVTATAAPALYQPLAGATFPALDGFAAVVRKYCVVNVAVYVAAAAGAVTVCEAVPPSDHFENTYWIPVVPACAAAAIVCAELCSHW